MIKFDSNFYVYTQNVTRMKNHQLYFQVTAVLMWIQKGSCTSLARQLCYNYKTSLETCCAVAFLPRQPGGPEKLECHLQETYDNNPMRCNVQKKCSPIMRLSL